MSQIFPKVKAGDDSTVVRFADAVKRALAPSSDITFNDLTLDGNLTLSGLTASRLVATNVNKRLVSTDLNSWVTGTTNQVNIADDGDGTITLSTPQNIHTAATPTFGDLTLSSPSNIYALSHDSFADFVANEHIDWTNASSNFKTTGYIESISDIAVNTTHDTNKLINISGSKTISGNLSGLSCTPVITTDQAGRDLYGLNLGMIAYTGGYDIANLGGVSGAIALTDNVTVTNAFGQKSSAVFTTGTITNYYGDWIVAPTGIANCVTAYGVYIGDFSGAGTTGWAIYSAGGDSYHAGDLAFGQTDKAERVGSDADNYLDLYGGTGIRIHDILIIGDNAAESSTINIAGSAGIIAALRMRNVTYGTYVRGGQSGGTLASPSATPDDTLLIGIYGDGYSNAWVDSKARIGLRSAGLWTATSTPTKIDWYTCSSGSTTPGQRMVLDSNGVLLTLNKIAFTQTDLNEYIDSDADGYLDLHATAEVRIHGEPAIERDVNSSDTVVYVKYFTGTTDADASTSIAHGVSGGAAKILTVNAAIYNSASTTYIVSENWLSASVTGSFYVEWDATNVNLQSVGTNLQGQAYTVKVEYIL